MPQYRTKKGDVVDADQFAEAHLAKYASDQDGSPLGVQITHITSRPPAAPDEPRTILDYRAQLDTADGPVIVEVGDWIVTTRKDRRAYKPEAFRALGFKPVHPEPVPA